jgi:serine protease Do
MTARLTAGLLACSLLAAAPGWAEAPREAALPSLAPLIDQVKGAVVNVDVESRAPLGDEQAELLRRFGRRAPGGSEAEGPVNAGMGSGFIIDPKGLVLTNNHVVEHAVAIRVRLDDGRAFDAEVVGRDPLTDVAVIRLKGRFDALPALKLGDSGALRQGDWVVAIGNPFGLASSVSVGIISALDRNIGAGSYDQFLQTDAAINPGNSGGPLFNLKGEVIGINTAIIGQATGIGFAVPSNLVKSVVPPLQKDGQVTRGWLGIGIQDLGAGLWKALNLASADGAIVTTVNEGSPAARAGLKEDDVVLAIDGEKVLNRSGLTRLVAFKRPDSTVKLTVVRAGKTLEVPVTIGVRPDLENLGPVGPRSSAGSDASTRQRIGLAFDNVDPRMADATGLPRAGALVVEVSPGSPAEKAGLSRGLVVIEVNHKPIRGRDDLAAALKDLKSGTSTLLRVTDARGDRRLMALELP